jgi:hypothetical protein
MNRTLIALAILIVATALGLGAQSNQLVDDLLAEEQATLGKTAYMTLAAAGLVSPDSSPAVAVQMLGELGWLDSIADEDAPISVGQYSQIVMQAFEMPGGLMYRLFPGPRYATREMAYRGLLDRALEPGDPLSGEEVLRILSYVLESGETQS